VPGFLVKQTSESIFFFFVDMKLEMRTSRVRFVRRAILLMSQMQWRTKKNSIFSLYKKKGKMEEVALDVAH
jgi:hypothetical protein